VAPAGAAAVCAKKERSEYVNAVMVCPLCPVSVRTERGSELSETEMLDHCGER
jgi:hypothetical protein